MSSSSGRRWQAAALAIAGAAGLAWTQAGAAVDLATLKVVPERGQSADQARRDRYECHNWAVEQTGGVVPEQPSGNERAEAERAKRADRGARAIIGALIGAGLGGLFHSGEHRRYHDGNDAVLAGAAVGAAVGAATGGRSEDKSPRSESDSPSDYLRALTACLEGRGYSVSVPKAD
jgi:hypothetical protein